MGNCCGVHGAKMTPLEGQLSHKKEGLLVGGGDGQLSGGGGRTGDKVRIRISKQQLEELLRRVEQVDHQNKMKKTMNVEEMVQRLIDVSDHFEIDHHQRWSWKPSLESIPEVN